MKLHFEFTTKIREKLQALIKGFFNAKNDTKGGKGMGIFDETVQAVFEGVLKVLRAIFGKTEWWQKVEEAIVIAILIAEMEPEDGEEKKREVMKKIYAYLEEFGINLKPRWVFDIVLGFAIDMIVNYLNENYGHEWIDAIEQKKLVK